MPDPVLPDGKGRMGEYEFLVLDGDGPMRVETDWSMRNLLRQDRLMTRWVRQFGQPWTDLPQELWIIIQRMMSCRTCLVCRSCMVWKPDDPAECFAIVRVQFMLYLNNNNKIDETSIVTSTLVHGLQLGPEGVTPLFPNNHEMRLLYQWRRAGWMKDCAPTLAEQALSPDFWVAMAAQREQMAVNEWARQTVVREERERARARRHGRRKGK